MSIDELTAFWRSVCIVNDNQWARLLDAPPGAAQRLHAAGIASVGEVLRASPKKLETALAGIDGETVTAVRDAAKAWLGDQAAGGESEPAPEPA